MNDDIDVEPNTLNSCEKFHYKENLWTQVADLNTERAYAGVVSFPQQKIQNSTFALKADSNGIKDSFHRLLNIYVFGGLQDFTALDSIEKYDALLDTWTTLSIKIPLRIAKIGVSVLEKGRSIILCGGIFSNQDNEFSYINTAYKLDFETTKWTKMPNMNENRVLYSSMPRSSDKIFAIGGSFEGI